MDDVNKMLAGEPLARTATSMGGFQQVIGPTGLGDTPDEAREELYTVIGEQIEDDHVDIDGSPETGYVATAPAYR